MLAPGTSAGLDRETAHDVLSQLEELQTARRHKATFYVFCPYCGEGFDTAHGLGRATPSEGPPRHGDPIGAADTVGGAERAARLMADAMAWRNDSLRGPDAFWVDYGRAVLWPLLYVAHHTGRDMADVRLLAHPPGRAETLVTVSTDLEAMAPSVDVDRVRRQWDRIAGSDPRALRAAFEYAYGMVQHWQITGPWAGMAGPPSSSPPSHT